MEKGICCAGNISVDLTYYVNTFPHEGELVHIESSGARSLGGLAANCIIDLATLDPELKLVLAGNVGNDEYGDFCRSVFSRYKNIDPSGLKCLGDTAYTLSISNPAANSRTFFTYTGGNRRFCEEDMKEALLKLKEYGVTIWTIIHCPEAGFGMDEHGNFFEADSLKLPEGYIVSTTGAGDAFCSGILYAAEKEWTLDCALILGNSAAAASLRGVCGTEGMSSLNEVLQLYKLYGKG